MPKDPLMEALSDVLTPEPVFPSPDAQIPSQVPQEEESQPILAIPRGGRLVLLSREGRSQAWERCHLIDGGEWKKTLALGLKTLFWTLEQEHGVLKNKTDVILMREDDCDRGTGHPIRLPKGYVPPKVKPADPEPVAKVKEPEIYFPSVEFLE